jgi:hypothetical protein
MKVGPPLEDILVYDNGFSPSINKGTPLKGGLINYNTFSINVFGMLFAM